jgi:hypothetical protein
MLEANDGFPTRRRVLSALRPRFGLKTLILGLAVASVLLGVFALYLEPVRTQVRALARLKKYGCEVSYDTRQPEWLWKLAGDGFYLKPVALKFEGVSLGHAQVADLCLFGDLKGLSIQDSQVAGDLKWITSLPQLVMLGFDRCPIDGIVDVRGYSQLKKLDLRFTNVDAVLVDGCIALESIDLRGTPVTDGMVEAICRARLPRLETLDIGGAGIWNDQLTDASLRALERVPTLRTLRTLYLYFAKTTGEGISRLQAANPRLSIIN